MRRRVELPARRITVGGHLLGPGRHELTVPLPGLDHALSLLVVVGVRSGKRAFLVGGTSPGDGLGLAVARDLLDELDPDELGGSIVALGHAAPPDTALSKAFASRRDAHAARVAAAVLAHVVTKAAFGVEVRAGPAGWATFPHLRADLDDERVRRLARAFGAEVVVAGAGGRGSLRLAAIRQGVPTVLFEGGEAGRHDPAALARAVNGVLNLLRAARMLPEALARPPWRATLADVKRARGSKAGWIVPLVAPGQLVAAGEPLAALHDDAGRSLGVVDAPSRSVVLAVPALSRLEAKGAVARIGRVVTLSRRRPEELPPPGPIPRVGWCEWVSLPELGIPRLHAKIDTGARTSALHVPSMAQVGDEDGRPILELHLPMGRRVLAGLRGRARIVRVVVQEHIVVRDSGGHAERRPVIETLLQLGPIHRRIRVTLTDRGDMLFPMLIGRTALGDDVVVDAAARHLLGDP